MTLRTRRISDTLSRRRRFCGADVWYPRWHSRSSGCRPQIGAASCEICGLSL